MLLGISKVLIHRQLVITARTTAGVPTLAAIKSNGTGMSSATAFASNKLASNLAGIQAAMNVTSNRLREGLILNEVSDFNSAALPDGFESVTFYVGDGDDNSRDARYTAAGPDSDLRHFFRDDVFSDNTTVPQTKAGQSAFDFGDAVLNNVKLGPENPVDDVTDLNNLLNVDMDSVVFASNSNFNNLNFKKPLTVLALASNTSFRMSQIDTTTAEPTGKVWRQNFYAKGINGCLYKNGANKKEINNLYKTPGYAQASCSNSFRGPGMDLSKEKITGVAGAAITVSESLEESILDGLNMEYVTFSGSLKNASFKNASMYKVTITGSIEGTDFTGIQANGTSNTNRGIDLSGVPALTATNKMPIFAGAQMNWASMMLNVVGSSSNMLDMTNSASLVNAQFNADGAGTDDVTWSYVNMEGADLTDSKWGANISDPDKLVVTGTSFKNCKLNNAKALASDGTTKFGEVPSLSYANFEGANLTKCNFFDFTNTLDAPNYIQARFWGIKHDDPTMTATNYQSELGLPSDEILLYKHNDGTFFGLPGGASGDYTNAREGLDLSGGLVIEGVTFKTAQQMGRSNMKNLTIQNCTFQGTAAATTTCAMELSHDDATEANYLENFQIKNCTIASGSVVVSEATDATERLVWGDKSTALQKLPCGANVNGGGGLEALTFYGKSMLNGNLVLSDNLIREARMLGGAYHDPSQIIWAGMDAGAVASVATVEACDLSNDIWLKDGVGVKNDTDPGALLFGETTNYEAILPDDVSQVDNYVLSPFGTIGKTGTNVTIAASQDFKDKSLRNMSIHANITTGGTTDFNGADLRGTNFNKSNLDAATFSHAIVDENTDLSNVVQTASKKLSGTNIKGDTTKLPVKSSTANTYTYVLKGGKLKITEVKS